MIGSGIAAQTLSPDDVGLQLLENAAATAAGLYALILIFGPVSGAHFNPVVSLVDAATGGLPWRSVAAYIPVQVAGCIAGAVLANVMFARDAVSISTTERATLAHGVAEVVATVGLLLVIFSLARSGRTQHAASAVGAYIGAGTSSPARPASPTPPSPSAGASATASRVSRPHRCCHSSTPSSSAVSSPWC